MQGDEKRFLNCTAKAIPAASAVPLTRSRPIRDVERPVHCVRRQRFAPTLRATAAVQCSGTSDTLETRDNAAGRRFDYGLMNIDYWLTKDVEPRLNSQAGYGAGRHSAVVPLRRSIGEANRNIAIEVRSCK